MWRYLPFSVQSGAENMAIDESIVEHMQTKRSPPTIRLYGWKPATITIGNFQCLNDEVDLEAAKKAGVDVIRRITGGGAVFHEYEVTYSIIASLDNFPSDIMKSYEIICGRVVSALKSLGIPAQFKAINDILVNNQKISGSAQTRRKGILLQHGTILYKVDVDKMFTLLKVGKEKVSDKFVQSVKKVVTSVEAQNERISFEKLVGAMQESFLLGRDAKEGALTRSEEKRAKALAVEKYSTMEWNDLRK